MLLYIFSSFMGYLVAGGAILENDASAMKFLVSACVFKIWFWGLQGFYRWSRWWNSKICQSTEYSMWLSISTGSDWSMDGRFKYWICLFCFNFVRVFSIDYFFAYDWGFNSFIRVFLVSVLLHLRSGETLRSSCAKSSITNPRVYMNLPSVYFIMVSSW